MELLQPIVLGGFDLVGLHALFDHGDKGQEQRPVEPAAIEVARGAVRGGDDHHLPGEKMLEQTSEDHGVGDVGHLELVKAEERGTRRDLLCRAPDRILGLLARPLDSVMGFSHEFLEMHAPLRRERNRVEEEIEQHRLAAANGAIEIEALRRLALPCERDEPHAEVRLGIVQEAVGEQFKLLGGQLLRDVRGEQPVAHHLPVAPQRSVLHETAIVDCCALPYRPCRDRDRSAML